MASSRLHAAGTKFDDFMIGLGFQQSNLQREGSCVYISTTPVGKIIIAVYVDDGLVAATNQAEMNLFIDQLHSRFEVVAKKVSIFSDLTFQVREIDQENP